MDANLMNCPKCGHTVSSTGRFCTYCGVSFQGQETDPQTDGKPPDGQPQTTTAPPPLPAQASEAVVDPPAEIGDSSAAEQTAVVAPPPAESALAPAETVMQEASDDSAAEVEIEMIDLEPVVEGGDASAVQADAGPQSAVEVTADDRSRETMPAEKEGGVEAGNPETGQQTAEATPSSPPPEILEMKPEDPLESETIGSQIAAMVNAEESSSSTIQPTPADEAMLPQEDAAPVDAGTPPAQADAVPMTPAPEVEINVEGDGVATVPADTPPSEVTTEVSQTGTDGADIELSADVNQVASGMPPGDDAAPAENEALKIQGAAQLAAEAMKIENAAQEMAEAVKQQKAKLAQTEASKERKTETAAARQKQRLKEKAIALKRKKAALARAAALKKQKQARAAKGTAKASNSPSAAQAGTASGKIAVQSLPSNTKMLKLLKKYKSQTIGINYDNSAEIRAAELVAANDEFFSVFVKNKQSHYHYPLSTILTIIEGQDGVSPGAPEKTTKFKAVIKVYPLVLF